MAATVNRPKGSIVVHDDVLRSEDADSVVFASIEKWGYGRSSGDWEALPARAIEHDLFEICCIPYRIYDVLVGDVVRAGLPIRELIEVVSASHSINSRVAISEECERSILAARLESTFRDCGAEFESGAVGLYAVDFTSPGSQQTFFSLADDLLRSGRVELESVCWADNRFDDLS